MDVNLKVPALEMLVKYTASGIGAVAGPMLAPWKARRESKAKLIEVEAEAGSLKLIATAQADARRSLISLDETGSGVLDIGPEGIAQRVEFQERKRQANIASVVREAAADLGDRIVLDQEPDPDWTARFFDCVQDVSSDDMRKLWAKVLSGEVESPGRTSLRTLDILKNMTGKEAELFNSACQYIINDFMLYPSERQNPHFPIGLAHLLPLQDMGLLHASTSLSRTLQFKELNSYIGDRGYVLKIGSKDDQKEVSISAIPLTRSGVEIFQVLEMKLSMSCLQLFARILDSKNCTLSFARILEEHPDGAVTHSNPFVPIEPTPQPSKNAAS